MHIKKIRFLFLGFVIAMLGFGFFAHTVYTQDYGAKTTADEAGLPTTGDIPSIIGNVVGAGLSLISVLFFILMIYAGIKWMTARGDEGTTKQALDTIFAAIIGIIIVLAAYAITNFVLGSVSGKVGGGDPDDAKCKAKGANYACVENAAKDTTCTDDPIPGLCTGKYNAETTKCCIPKNDCPFTQEDKNLCNGKQENDSCDDGALVCTNYPGCGGLVCN